MIWIIGSVLAFEVAMFGIGFMFNLIASDNPMRETIEGWLLFNGVIFAIVTAFIMPFVIANFLGVP